MSIIDLKTGDPPITNEEDRIGGVLNGEIYNFRTLRDELRRRNHHLHTQGDTEVLVHLAEDLAPVELARRLEGMFAFAIWDGDRLVLGRDRLGKKPLYYWQGPGRLVFGSEIKAVLAHPWVPRDLNPGAIDAYLTFGYVPTPSTFFAGIRSLPPGHVAHYQPGTSELVLEQYWSLSEAANVADMTQRGGTNVVARVRDALTSAVTKRMVADVPMGAFLSGGIDSSSVVAVMSEHSERAVSTFTIGFDDEDGFDERSYARMVARRFGTDHTEFVVNPDATSLVDRLIDHYDEPFGDSSALPTYLLSELTRGHVTVALCGDGGDESFAGYERLAAALALGRLRLLPPRGREAAAHLLQRLSPAFGDRDASMRRFLQRCDLPPHRALLSWVSYTPDDWRSRLRPGASNWAFDEYDRLWQGTTGLDLLGRLQALTMVSYLLDDLLVKVDRASMAHGLEVRSPFLDADLVALGLSLHSSKKIAGMSLKRVLKSAMKDTLPPEILRRPKRGFGVPLDRWFRTDLRSYLHGALGAPSARVRDHLAPEAIDALLAEHDREQANHGHTLWTLLTLELFLQKQKW